MIKLTITEKLETICDFIDNRLVLIMAEKNLRQLNLKFDRKVMIKKEYRLKNIDNTILYLEKEPNRISMAISTIEKKDNKPLVDNFGVCITVKNSNEIEFYIDTLDEAFKKGILKSDMENSMMPGKVIYYILFAILLLILTAITGGLALIGICLIGVICYPVVYFFKKRLFNKKQQKIESLVSIFEKEFNVTNKVSTNDWISFWGKIKSNVKDEIKASLPIAYS